MIGYLLEQELGNVLPFETPLATILTMIEVDPADPAFADPTKFVGPVYEEAEARALAEREGLGRQARRREVPAGRRVAAPAADLRDPADPLAAGTGHGRDLRRRWRDPDDVRPGAGSARWSGVEAVIDKDLASALLARELGADVFIMATDVDGVYDGWGTPDQRRLPELKADDASTRGFAAGSMGPKVEAAAEFATADAASGRRSGRSTRSTGSWPARPARAWWPEGAGQRQETRHTWERSASTPRSASCGGSSSIDPT